jgi:hypothetical protein
MCTHWISNINLYKYLWYVMDQVMCFWIWKKNHQAFSKNWSRYTQKTGNAKCNKTITALHFVQHDVLWSSMTHHIALARILSLAVYHIALAIFINIHAMTLYYYYHYYFNKTNSTIKITSYQINHMNTCCLCFFIRPSVKRDVLWYTNVRPSVCPFHLSRSNLRTPRSIHFKFHRVIGIDGLTVCILFGEISYVAL